MFDEKTQQQLKAYVYMLIDPRDNKPFYIGKGNNNRVFQHLERAINNEDVNNLKYEQITQILSSGYKVKHLIIRHGLKDNEAFDVECALIDSFEYFGFNLSNIVSGHNSIEKGLMTSDEVIALYNAQPLEELEINCLIININRTYQRHSGVDAIYNATKETWRMRNPINKIEYVLSEYHGLIVEVFKVTEWYTKMRKTKHKNEIDRKEYLGYGFNGVVADQECRNKYLNKSIAHLKKKGAANVIRYNI
jgi:hypothetical protein